ncbi:MAG: vitamin B12-dependent ribonucleotide reductase [Deltaproteobacteria bacterium]|nr:vitamin B12-dependent ribonucleotide reductase [Deltaproteobacteria bacterium]
MLEKQTEMTSTEKTSPTSRAAVPQRTGLRIQRFFTEAGSPPMEQVKWERRDALISGGDGKIVFEQPGVEVPVGWSQLATNVVVQKYFRGALGTPERETSMRQLIGRVVQTITRWGREQRYFASQEDADTFADELCHLLVTQRAAFNSPVWFNVGVEEHPQCSACFINSVDDTMESIMELAKTEGMLFKWGSGTGSNFSTLRSSRELLNGGGEASGPVSFMKGYDAFAGVIKSGGKTRRAAKMVILNADHPDIFDYIWCKAKEEKKAWSLIDSGYDGSFNGEAYASVFFQNSNNSVRVSDEFMEAVVEDRDWDLRSVRTGEVVKTIKARSLMDNLSEAAHQCGDPGMQFDSTINSWHTCPNTDRINASNPCSEYMFLDDSACNLSSLNLRKFQFEDGALNVDAFRRAVGILILAQEIIIDNAKYPTPKIAVNSHRFRPLGLGYANLGALLMSRGLPYDSDAGRAFAGALTALMHGEANRVSSLIAADRGPFEGYGINREPMLKVMREHRDAVEKVDAAYVPYDVINEARKVWDEVLELGEEHGYRNAQVSVLAPTGTIAFMMDCDTTGIEPDIALVKYKKLVGGGMLKMVNGTVPEALAHLGYEEDEVASIVDHIDKTDCIEGAPALKDEHLPVFDCAFMAAKGKRAIHYMGHIRMMSAVQPFLSGAISKTVNMPTDATPEDIENAYIQAWRLGIKSLAVYRDGCKRSQPLNTKQDSDSKKSTPAHDEQEELEPAGPPKAVRNKMPSERRSITHKFSIGGQAGYLTVGMYDDGRPGEIFVRMAKEGSTISGLMDSFATAISLSLQHGVPLRLLVEKFSHTRFEPSGWTDNRKIGFAKSILDYIFRWIEVKFPEGRYADQQTLPGFGINGGRENEAVPQTGQAAEFSPVNDLPASPRAGARPEGQQRLFTTTFDAPPCSECGSLEMVPNGTCYKCMNCGATSGCS